MLADSSSFSFLKAFCSFLFLEFRGKTGYSSRGFHLPIVSDAVYHENYHSSNSKTQFNPDTNICVGVPEGGRDICRCECCKIVYFKNCKPDIKKQVAWMGLKVFLILYFPFLQTNN